MYLLGVISWNFVNWFGSDFPMGRVLLFDSVNFLFSPLSVYPEFKNSLFEFNFGLIWARMHPWLHKAYSFVLFFLCFYIFSFTLSNKSPVPLVISFLCFYFSMEYTYSGKIDWIGHRIWIWMLHLRRVCHRDSSYISRGFTRLRLSEFAQISEFFLLFNGRLLADIWVICQKCKFE